MAKLRSGVFTVILDKRPHKCNANTYQNWVTFKVTRVDKGFYHVERLTNNEGNGQCYAILGHIVGDSLRLAPNANDSLTVMAATVLARHFRLEYANELSVKFPNAVIKNPRGNRTAGPTLLRPKSARDKNENNMRKHVASIDIAAAMAARQG
jgi:hypothetical protein